MSHLLVAVLALSFLPEGAPVADPASSLKSAEAVAAPAVASNPGPRPVATVVFRPVPTDYSPAGPPAPAEAQAQRIPVANMALRETKIDTPIPGKPVRYVRVPMNSVRIDKKKPYMRIYYWPPLPPQGEGDLSGMGANGGRNGSSSTGPLDYGMNLDPVYFPFNTSDMVAPASHLQRIAGWVKANPANHLTLIGHADPRGTKSRNEMLSVERAVIVKNALVGLGAPSNQVTTEGMGARKPVRRGKSQESHNWGSRRVEFSLHRPNEVLSQGQARKDAAVSAAKSVEAKPTESTEQNPKG